jgi:hypothetical protein
LAANRAFKIPRAVTRSSVWGFAARIAAGLVPTVVFRSVNASRRRSGYAR